MKWCGDGEAEPMENLHLINGITALAIMEIGIVQKYFNLLILKSLGLWFSASQVIWNSSIVHYEKINKWLQFHKYASYMEFQITDTPSKFGSLVF